MQKSLRISSTPWDRSCWFIWGVCYVRFSYYAWISFCKGKDSGEVLVKCIDGILLILMITFPAQVNSEKNCEWEDPAGFPKRCSLNSHWIIPSSLSQCCCSLRMTTA